MKILIAAGIYPPDAGGPAVHAKAQFEGFPKFGFETSLVALAHYRNWPSGLRHLIFFITLLSKVRSCDVVYAHDAVGVGIPGLFAARIYRKKFVVRIGGDLAWEHYAEKRSISLKEWYNSNDYKYNLRFILSRYLMNNADLVFVPSQLLVDLYTHTYHIDVNKIKLINNPLPASKILRIERNANIIWASRLAAYKNLGTTLRAMKDVFNKNPEIKFIIMGNGPEKENLERLVVELGISNKVVFTDSVSQAKVLEETSKCLFVIAPALTEFNPNYVLQGISYGKPFLISRENGLPFKVPESMELNPRNTSEMAQKIKLMLDPTEYAKAKEFLSSINLKMTWEDNLKANAEILTSLLKGSK